MKKKRALRILSLILLCALTFTACKKNVGTPEDNAASKDENTEEKDKDEHESWKIGFSGIDMENPYFLTLESAIKEEVDGKNCELIVKDPKTDPDMQASQIQEMIDEGINAIILSPVDWEKITPSLEALKEADLSTKYNGLNVVYTYEINDNNKEKIIDKFKSLIKDDEVLSSYLKDDELSLENVKIVVEVSIFGNKIENFTITSEDMEVKGVRTKGNTYEVASGEEKFNLEVTKEKIVISGNDEYNEPFNLKIEVKDKKIEINLKSSTTVFNMTLINKKNTSNIKLIIEAEGLKVDGNIDVTTDNKNKKEDLTGKINVSYSDYNITLDISSKSEYGKNIINKKDYKDAVDINDITEKDSNTLMTNTMDKISEFKAYKAIEDLLSFFNTSWDDTEDDLLENTCENICPGGKVSDYDFGTCICEDGEEIEV